MSHIAWTSPVRKSGKFILPPIPNEIYLEIFSYLRPSDPNEWIDAETRQNFCNLALVCRFFSCVMLPWIFENLTFVEKNPYSQTSRLGLSSTVSAKFCRNILDGDTVASLLAKQVKRWAFFGSPIESKLTPAFLSMYFETFEHMHNLLELSLSNIVIPKDFFKRLANVPTLEAIKFDTCSLDAKVLKKHLKQFESLPLKQFALVHRIPDSNLWPLLPHLNMTSLIRLELEFCHNLEYLPHYDGHLPLEELHLGVVGDFLPLAEFLEKTPDLKILRVIRWSKITGSLKPEVIPQLTGLEADWSFCKRILPGRPIARLGLLSGPSGESENEVDFLTRSTKPIIELKISHNFPFWEHFPDLENLETWLLDVEGGAWGESVKSTIREWRRCPNLRFLGLRFSANLTASIDTQERHVLDFLNLTFPVLTRVYFAFALNSLYFHTWSYTRVVGGSWHRAFRAGRLPSMLCTIA